MKLRIVPLALLCLVSDVARGDETRPIAADLIVRVGRIWTGDAERPWAEAVAVRDGTLVAVGSAADVEPFRGPRTRVVSRLDAFATPGLIDAHGHLTDLGAEVEEVDLRGVDRIDEATRRVRAWMDAHPGDSWVRGGNWDQSLWPGGAFPTAVALDAIAPDRPVFLTRVDGHAAWLNSEALRRAKINKESVAPPDGQIIRDQDGRPSGVLIDGAKDQAALAMPRSTKADYIRHALAGQALCLKAGLTGVHVAGMTETAVEALRDLDASGRLKLRVYGMANPPLGREVEFARRTPSAAKPGDRFELRTIKLFIDGAMGSRGGLLFAPYSDAPDNKGLLLIAPEVLVEATIEALRHGWQMATHAIGDRGNALVLDAYEAARKAVPEVRDSRLRIEHAQVVRQSDVPRFAALGVIASMQPSHASDDMRWADARLGSGRVEGAYAWRWFFDARVQVAFGSDFPVEIVDPFWGIYAALTRQDENGQPPGGWHPDQRLTLDETLRAFTAGSAYAAFAEDRLGVLAPGKRADLTVVDRDLFKISPAALLKTKVVLTIVDGAVEYDRE